MGRRALRDELANMYGDYLKRRKRISSTHVKASRRKENLEKELNKANEALAHAVVAGVQTKIARR